MENQVTAMPRIGDKAPEFKETLTEAPSNEYLYSLIEA